ncbi:MAG: efflux RND transporter periplasmic adaptor subunit [Gemmatimonadetes bacterium]|nr:efflux RND transporter periplasmic adaptor subunit [Gemmatimonadota bacterium]
MFRSARAPGAMMAILFAVGVVTMAACGKKSADADMPQTVSSVTIGSENVVVVGNATLNSGPTISGTLAAEKTASIRAEIGGPVVAVLIEPGQRVSKGTALARIDESAVREAWLSARSGVTQATMAADNAVRDLSRAEKLLAAGAIAENALEGARRGNLGAQAQLEDAKARLASAQRNLDNTVVKSPYDGVVSEKQVNPGDVVAPGAPLFTVVDPSTMRLEGAVPADQLAQVRMGAPVIFSITGYPGKSYTGAITNIYPSADPQTRQVRVYVRIPNAAQGLVAGLYATGRVASVTRNGLTAPLTAVDQRGITPFVVRLKGGKTERVSVTIGVRDETTERMELTSGVAAGDTLLIGAAQGITSGTPVKVAVPADKPIAPKS